MVSRKKVLLVAPDGKTAFKWRNTMIKWDVTIINSPVINSLAIALSTILLAYLVRFIMDQLLKRIAKKIKVHLYDHLLEVVRRPIFATILLYGLYLSCYPLHISSGPLTIVQKVINTLIIAFWVFAGMGFGAFFVDWAYERKGQTLIQLRTKPLFIMILKIVVFVVGSYLALLTWGKNATALLTSASVVGLVLGFAAKDSLANLFSGVSIMADAPYKIGDYIVLGSGERGHVTNIGLRSTRIMTRDDVEIIIPNSVIGNEKIINQSGGPSEMYRIRVSTSVAYGSNAEQVREVLLKVGLDEELALNDPKPEVFLVSLGDSGLIFDLCCWVKHPAQKNRLEDRLNTEMYNRLNEAGIEIPYPKRDVYLYKQN
ncbi:MAG: mechanosensitive ion channel protein [Acidobacteria bacterium]|nr:MAG: mechanosensitive ion channel protein [Acidobacteriota bacterium]